ncbi:MAG: cache domain-containing protein [Lachnospiraceae bacterium]|nr:cache domain-containing protein [Lachnospiraceae bacterium]
MMKRLSNRLMLIVLVPLVFITAFLVIIAAVDLKNEMYDSKYSELATAVFAVEDTLHVGIEGEITLNEDETLSLGDTNLNENIGMFDEFTKKRGVDITLFYGDTRRLTTIKDAKTGDRLIGTKASDEVIEKVLKGGEDMVSDKVVINEIPYLVYYTPMKDVNGKVVGMYFAGTPKADIAKMLKTMIVKLIVIAVVMMIIVCILTVMLTRKIANAVRYGSDALTRISHGDLGALDNPALAAKLQNRGDEIGEVVISVMELRARFERLVNQLKSSAQQLEDTAIELSNTAEGAHTMTTDVASAVDEVANGATTQATATMEAQTQTEILSAAVSTITTNVDDLYSNVGNMIESSKIVNSNMDELLKSNEQTLTAVEKINEQEAITAESVRSIQKAADMITDIASQTNLLSLNASIEAARAGEAGRGFAVVASEISGLAEQSNASAKEISVIIQQLLQESETSLAVAKNLKEVAEVQGDRITETKEAIDTLSGGIDLTGKSSGAIEAQVGEISGARDSIVDQVDSLSAISEENAASAQQTTASTSELNQLLENLNQDAEELTAIATQLNEQISFFH